MELLFIEDFKFEVLKLSIPVRKKFAVLKYFDVAKFIMLQEQNFFIDISSDNMDFFRTFEHVH